MSNDPKQPTSAAAPMILRAFYLRHNETYAPGVDGYVSVLSFWDREKHPKLLVEEQKNGDMWLTTPRGTRIEISVLAISYKVRGPETLKQSEAVRR